MLEALDRGRSDVSGAKRFFRNIFENEDVQPDLLASRDREVAIDELRDQIETLQLRIATSTDPKVTKLADFRLSAANRALLKVRDEREADRDLAKAALTDIVSPEVGDVVLDEYVDRLLAYRPQPVDNTPSGLKVRAELREIARQEAVAALVRSSNPATTALPLSTPLEQNATDQSPPLTVKEYYDEIFRHERGLKTKRGEVGLSPSGMEKCLEGARDFTDIMGNMRITSVTPAHVREFKNAMLKVPAHWRKRTANSGNSLRQLIGKADAETVSVDRLAAETVNSTLTGLRQIFAFAVDNEHIRTNPASGVTAERAKDKDIDPAFEVADLNKLFASPWFAGCISDENVRASGNHLIRDHRFWAFLCMLFSGARVAEIGGIHTTQVHVESDVAGFFEFDWTEGEDGRRIKNASSVRIVPIHSELVRIGFIEYVETIRAAGHERLFPSWIPQRRRIDDSLFKNEYSSSPFLKRFKTYLVWLGVKRPGLSVKSFRATWETASLGTDINERSLLKIAGRAQSGALSRYLPMKTKYEQLLPVMNKIIFPNLNIDHLASGSRANKTSPIQPHAEVEGR